MTEHTPNRTLARQIKARRGTLSQPEELIGFLTDLAQIDDLNTATSIGHALRKLTLSDFGETPALPIKELKFALLSNGTITNLETLLRVEMLKARILPRIYMADFDQVTPELMQPDSPSRQFDPDVTICLLDEHVITSRLNGSIQAAEIEATIEECRKELFSLWTNFASTSRSLLVLNTLALPKTLLDTIVDYRSKARVSAAWRRFNTAMLELVAKHHNIVVVDLEPMLNAQGVGLRDDRLALFAKMYLDDTLLWQLAREYRKVSQSLAGFSKKCLIMDCDNTLWGGTIGDDGMSGITLGGSPEGEGFAALQASAQALSRQGVLLALASKNDRANTDEVFSQHPDAQLKLDDFSAQQVNWDPKPDNVRAMARKLNLSTEHCVFLDDSAFECDLMRQSAPEVHVIQMPQDVSEAHEKLLSEGLFNRLESTQADLDRKAYYQADAQREELQSSTTSYEDYLARLQLTMRLFKPGPMEIPRVAQITQKTNQFNLTTWRMSEADVTQRVNDDRWDVIAVQTSDRFGSNGIVGVVFVEHTEPKTAIIHNFLLSCRVFSRGIENCVIAALGTILARKGIETIIGLYKPSPKNGGFAELYAQNGFTKEEEGRFQARAQETLGKSTPWIDFTNEYED